MKVFWSWQSDTNEKHGRHFIKDALQEAVRKAAQQLSIAEADRPEVDHDTKDVPGLAPIVDTIFDKIASASLFVADVTIVGASTAGKPLPNPNVMIELGHALTSLGFERIILVWNTAEYGSPSDLPFDLRHRRQPIGYSLLPNASAQERAQAKQTLVAGLVGALKVCVPPVLESRAAAITYSWHPALANDRSTWLKQGERVQHTDPAGRRDHFTWRVAVALRGYLRIIPARWPDMSVADVEIFARKACVDALGAERSVFGGRNALGLLRALEKESFDRDGEGVAFAITQIFKTTGEIWSFNAGYGFPFRDIEIVGWKALAQDWRSFLARCVAFYKEAGVAGPLCVEVGATCLKECKWTTDFGLPKSALEDSMHHQATDPQWGEAAQLQFIHEALNKLAEAYGVPAMRLDEIEAITG